VKNDSDQVLDLGKGSTYGGVSAKANAIKELSAATGLTYFNGYFGTKNPISSQRRTWFLI